MSVSIGWMIVCLLVGLDDGSQQSVTPLDVKFWILHFSLCRGDMTGITCLSDIQLRTTQVNDEWHSDNPLPVRQWRLRECASERFWADASHHKDEVFAGRRRKSLSGQRWWIASAPDPLLLRWKWKRETLKDHLRQLWCHLYWACPLLIRTCNPSVHMLVHSWSTTCLSH